MKKEAAFPASESCRRLSRSQQPASKHVALFPLGGNTRRFRASVYDRVIPYPCIRIHEQQDNSAARSETERSNARFSDVRENECASRVYTRNWYTQLCKLTWAECSIKDCRDRWEICLNVRLLFERRIQNPRSIEKMSKHVNNTYIKNIVNINNNNRNKYIITYYGEAKISTENIKDTISIAMTGRPAFAINFKHSISCSPTIAHFFIWEILTIMFFPRNASFTIVLADYQEFEWTGQEGDFLNENRT